MKSEPIIADIARGVNIWEGVRQEINCFGKRLIEALLKEELLSYLGRRAYERLPHSRSQRCCFHKIANIKLHLQDRSHRREIMREASHIYRAPSEVEAYHRAAGFYHRWQALEPRVVANFLQDIDKSLSYFHLPLKERKHRSKLKTVNKLESFFRGLRRRINNMGTFENIKSLERHLFALIIINKTKQDTPCMLFTQNS